MVHPFDKRKSQQAEGIIEQSSDLYKLFKEKFQPPNFSLFFSEGLDV